MPGVKFGLVCLFGVARGGLECCRGRSGEGDDGVGVCRVTGGKGDDEVEGIGQSLTLGFLLFVKMGGVG